MGSGVTQLSVSDQKCSLTDGVIALMLRAINVIGAGHVLAETEATPTNQRL
jgi:hypothetical protein